MEYAQGPEESRGNGQYGTLIEMHTPGSDEDSGKSKEYTSTLVRAKSLLTEEDRKEGDKEWLGVHKT